jgi:peptidoglycan/xylan/chitin deacetylase (PgdA/CDA1 family)
LLQLFDRYAIRATFFVIGADVTVAWKRRQLEAVCARGHELANHSMSHDLGLGRADARHLEQEIAACQRQLARQLDVEARGFRAPGYGLSADLIDMLARNGFLYDASLLPTPWAWVLRRIDRWMVAASGGRATNGDRRRPQYGVRHGWRAPLRPYTPDRRVPAKPAQRDNGFWEIPVSVSRRLRLPFHGGVGFALGRAWVDRAVRSLSREGGFLNYVMHGIDLVDGAQWGAVTSTWGRRFFAGGSRERFDFFAATCREIANRFAIVRTDRWVEKVRGGRDGEGNSTVQR